MSALVYSSVESFENNKQLGLTHNIETELFLYKSDQTSAIRCHFNAVTAREVDMVVMVVRFLLSPILSGSRCG